MNPDMAYSEFESICAMLGDAHAAIKFAIGDAILAGEKLYGEDCYQAVELLNMSEESRRECVRVSERVPFSRRNIYKRDRFQCQYCGTRTPIGELTIDHVLPRARGGRSTWENCVLACLRCNRRKGHRLPSEAGLQLRRPPREPHWSPCISIPLAKRRASWEQFVSEQYWNVELEA